MKKLLILMLLGVLFVPMNRSAKADEVLYCQTKLATGLYLKMTCGDQVTLGGKGSPLKLLAILTKS